MILQIQATTKLILLVAVHQAVIGILVHHGTQARHGIQVQQTGIAIGKKIKDHSFKYFFLKEEKIL